MSGWTRRWHIASRARLHQVLSSIAHTMVSEAAPLELILRTQRLEKTGAQRALFHAICADLAPHMHMAPGAVKLKVKASFYGVEIRDPEADGVFYAVVPSSEDSDREEYSRLIDHAYQWAAEKGINIPDRRPR